MLAFGLGTVPALVLVGIAGRSAGHHFLRVAAALAPVALLLNAALLTALPVKALAGLWSPGACGWPECRRGRLNHDGAVAVGGRHKLLLRRHHLDFARPFLGGAPQHAVHG
jgi:hypothetical protein